MYTKLLTLFEQIAQKETVVETVRDSAVGASVNIVRQGASLTIDLALNGPCNLQQLTALLSAHLQHTISFTEQKEGRYTTTVPVSETILSESPV